MAPSRSISMPLMTTAIPAHMRKTPKRVSSMGALRAAERPRPRTAPAVGRRDDAIVPEPRAGVIGMALALVLGADGGLEGLLLFRRPGRLHIVLLDLGEDRGRLLAAHHGDACIGPHPEEAWTIGPAAHAVIAGPEAAADDERQLRYPGGGDRRHHLRPVLGNAAGFVFAADHEAGDVLEENERDAALGAKLDEMRALEGRFRKQDPIIGDDADGIAVEPREAADQRRAIELLELVEDAAIDQAGDDLADVIGLLRIARDDAAELRRIEAGLDRISDIEGDRLRPVEMGDGPAADRQSMGIVLRIVIDHARAAGMDIGAAEILRAHLLARGRLHQRWSAEENGALVADDDRLIRHGGHIGAAGGAGSHDDGDLGDARRRHVRLVEEDPPEMLAVGKDLVLARQIGTAGIDEIETGQPVLQRDLLGPQMLLHRQRIIGTALDRGVIGHDDAFAALDPADAGDDPGGRHHFIVDTMGSELGELEERRAGIQQQSRRAGGARACRGRDGAPWLSPRRPSRSGRPACADPRRGHPWPRHWPGSLASAD